MNGVQGPSRLLNHSRFPNGRAHGFAAPLRVALGLRPKCPQGTRFPARLPGFGAAPQALCRSTKKRALRVPEGHKKRASLNPSPNISANGAAILHPEGPRRFYSKNIIIWKDPRFSLPFGRSQRSTGFAAGSAAVLPLLPASTRVSRVPSVARNARRALPPEALASSCVFLHQAAFLASRLLNHSRFPDGRAHGFAVPLRVALGLWPKCPQGTRFPSRLRSLATLTAFAAAEVFGALPQTPARA